jgi:hypothetical protein
MGGLIALAMMLWLEKHYPPAEPRPQEQVIPCCLSRGCARHHQLSGNPCGQSWDWEVK